MSIPSFTSCKSVLAVIHCDSMQQTLRNTQIAAESGCDGVFLINHTVSAESMSQILRAVRVEFPDYWLGANFLGMNVVDVFRRVPLEEINGIWTDDACIDERNVDQPDASEIQIAIQACGWKGSYFGGVAFKYQREVEDLAAAARLASNYMDVVCTSGPGTGKAASIDKLAAMKTAIGSDVPLAVASGITPENVDQALPWADLFLVATGISESFTQLDPQLVQSLTRKVQQYDSRIVQ